MPKEILTRRAADNPYLHKDFHVALSTGIAYLESRFGAQAVRDYLKRLARGYYAPLTRSIQEKGLAALRDYLQGVYAQEGGKVATTFSDDEMLVEVDECPAVMHMRAHGYAVAPLFSETGKTLYEELCEGTPFVAEWLRYDELTGASAVRFRRRHP
jgi:hypothetical protein